MKQYLLGAVAAIVVNLLTVVGWMTIGPLFPAGANVLIALVIAGLWGLDDEWAFPLGYWTVELLMMVAAVSLMGVAPKLIGL